MINYKTKKVALNEIFEVDKKLIEPKTSQFDLLPFIGLENITSNTREYTEQDGYNPPASNCFYFDKRHILYGKLRPYLNKVYLPEKEGKCSMEILPLLPKNGYKREFIAALMQSGIVMDLAVKFSTGGRMPRANMDKIMKMIVDLPTDVNVCNEIGLQTKVKMVSQKQMRESAQRQEEAVNVLQDSILREVFSYKVGDQLPSGWSFFKIKDIADISPGKSVNIQRHDNDPTSFIPMEAVNEISGEVSLLQTRTYGEVKKGYTYFENGDIIFAKITPCMQNGKSAIVDNLIGGFGYGSTEFTVLRAKSGRSNEWILHFLRTSEFRKDAEDHFTGSAGQQRVPSDFVSNYSIPYPASDEVKPQLSKIKLKLNQAQKARDTINKQKETISALPSSILRRTFAFN